ncbi:MAG: hypothetical protein WAO76_07365 [Georgfuchsia sp.]
MNAMRDALIALVVYFTLLAAIDPPAPTVRAEPVEAHHHGEQQHGVSN